MRGGGGSGSAMVGGGGGRALIDHSMQSDYLIDSQLSREESEKPSSKSRLRRI